MENADWIKDRKIEEGLELFETNSTDTLIKICKNIVRGDMNRAGTLVRYHFLNKKIFVKEYSWIIIKSWDCLSKDIELRRKQGIPKNYMENFEKLVKEARKFIV
jgi:hypothetical protein